MGTILFQSSSLQFALQVLSHHFLQVYEHGSEINARGDSISIGGISAGGTMSAVVQQLARDAGILLKLGK